MPIHCPSDGAFVAWKKLKNDLVAKLMIPEDARRSSATTNKCRADKAVVLGIYGKNGKEYDSGVSSYDNAFVYTVGKTVIADKYDDDRWNECSNGIHFFVTREEAERY